MLFLFLEEMRMNLLLVEPGKKLRTVETRENLKNTQAIVGCPIQTVFPFVELVPLICHDEWKLLGRPLNRATAESPLGHRDTGPPHGLGGSHMAGKALGELYPAGADHHEGCFPGELLLGRPAGVGHAGLSVRASGEQQLSPRENPGAFVIPGGVHGQTICKRTGPSGQSGSL